MCLDTMKQKKYGMNGVQENINIMNILKVNNNYERATQRVVW